MRLINNCLGTSKEEQEQVVANGIMDILRRFQKREKNIPPDLTISKLNADLNSNASSSQRGL